MDRCPRRSKPRLAARARDARRAPGSTPLGLCLLALATLAGCRGAGARQGTFVAQIEQRNRQMELAFGAGNLLGVADVYADDAWLLPPEGGRIQGRAEIDQHWSAIGDPLDWRLVSHDIEGSELQAYELGRSDLTVRRDGVVQRSVTEFLWLWRRGTDGTWRIAMEAWWPAPR